jgi:uncharacterized membrane protein YagU involved in acid resistance
MGLISATQKWYPAANAPVREDPGKHMMKRVKNSLPDKGESIPEEVEEIAAQLLGGGYGIAGGVLYAALSSKRCGVLKSGSLLGLGVWAAGYLGWIPALEIAPPLQEHRAEEIAGPIIQHLAYGIATAAVYHLLEN